MEKEKKKQTALHATSPDPTLIHKQNVLIGSVTLHYCVNLYTKVCNAKTDVNYVMEQLQFFWSDVISRYR
jgi:hypothetical protein